MGFSDFGYVIILSHDGGPYHIEISPLIFRANQWTDFYILGISVMKELIVSLPLCICGWEMRQNTDRYIVELMKV